MTSTTLDPEQGKYFYFLLVCLTSHFMLPKVED